MNIFSYSIKKSDREELEQELGKRLTDVEYNSIVNSVNSIKDNLNKIDLASILSPTETEAPNKPVEEKSNPKSSGSVAAASLSLAQPVNPNSSQKSNSPSSPSLISTKSNAGGQSSQKSNSPSSPSLISTKSNAGDQSSQKSNSTLSPSLISTKSNARGQTFKIPIKKEWDDEISFNERNPLNNRTSKIRYVSGNQDYEQKYLKYKNKYLSLKQKMEN